MCYFSGSVICHDGLSMICDSVIRYKASNIGILHQKYFICSKQLLVTVPCREHRLWRCFHSANVGKLVVNVDIQVVLPKIALIT